MATDLKGRFDLDEDGKLDLSPYIRDITDEHVVEYWEKGWVVVRGFVDPALCDEVIRHYMDWIGLRWREWPSDPAEQREFVEVSQRIRDNWGSRFAIRQHDPWMFNYVTQPKFGEAAARFMKVPAVKTLSETLHVKFPQSSGHSRKLEWHQDFPSIPIDRAEAVQFWLALVSITPDMGPMTHLNGSHREPPGGMMGVVGEDATEIYPELFERYTESEPGTYAPGDAVFHNSLTWHASGVNRTDRVRWAMSSYRISARSRYTGQHNFNTDGLGLVPNQHFDHPNFPTVYPVS